MSSIKKGPPKRFQMRLVTILAGLLSLGASFTIAHFISTEYHAYGAALVMLPFLLFISAFVMLVTETIARWQDGDEWN